MHKKELRILGIRGIPAAHGGFETFAESLALDLVNNGWNVIVYCQEDGVGAIRQDLWQGIHRVIIPISASDSIGSVIFDWRSISHALIAGGLCLTLGYNTALFSARLRLADVPNIMNMDGIEWRRAKWGVVARIWFWLNERAACWFVPHLIADHPLIKDHLASRGVAKRVSMIPYGAASVTRDERFEISRFGLKSGQYLIVVARPEPENSIFEIVNGFSLRRRSIKLAVLGYYDKNNPYHQKVFSTAGDEVSFLGPIYEKSIVQQLRAHALGYIHGHQVGGTNPSLVESLAAGNAVFAHDNGFNRWVAGTGAVYFKDSASLDAALTNVLADRVQLARMGRSSVERHREEFTTESVLIRYRLLLEQWLPDLAIE